MPIVLGATKLTVCQAKCGMSFARQQLLRGRFNYFKDSTLRSNTTWAIEIYEEKVSFLQYLMLMFDIDKNDPNAFIQRHMLLLCFLFYLPY